MNGLPSACAVVCLLAFVFGNLPSCIGSVEGVLTSSKENVTVDEVISHGQPLSEVTEKAAIDMQSDQPLPDDPEFVCGDDSINVKINYNDVDNLSVLAREYAFAFQKLDQALSVAHCSLSWSQYQA